MSGTRMIVERRVVAPGRFTDFGFAIDRLGRRVGVWGGGMPRDAARAIIRDLSNNSITDISKARTLGAILSGRIDLSGIPVEELNQTLTPLLDKFIAENTPLLAGPAQKVRDKLFPPPLTGDASKLVAPETAVEEGEVDLFAESEIVGPGEEVEEVDVFADKPPTPKPAGAEPTAPDLGTDALLAALAAEDPAAVLEAVQPPKPARAEPEVVSEEPKAIVVEPKVISGAVLGARLDVIDAFARLVEERRGTLSQGLAEQQRLLAETEATLISTREKIGARRAHLRSVEANLADMKARLKLKLETQIAELQQSETERIASVESSYPEPTDGSEAALALARQLRQSAISEETEVIKRQTAEEIAALQAQLEEHALNLALQNSGQLAQSRLTRRLDLSREIQEADQCAERLSEEITNLGQMADELKEQLSALAKEAEPLFPELEELRQTFNARIDELFALLRGTTGA